MYAILIEDLRFFLKKGQHVHILILLTIMRWSLLPQTSFTEIQGKISGILTASLAKMLGKNEKTYLMPKHELFRLSWKVVPVDFYRVGSKQINTN